MVLMSVDLPNPVWPIWGARRGSISHRTSYTTHRGEKWLTDDDNVELEAAFEQLALNLAGNRVEADVRRRTDLFSSWRGHVGLNERIRRV